MEHREGAMQIAARLPASSVAIPLIENQSNMSECVRIILEDFVKANGIPKGYASIPEKNRLKEYFGVKPPRHQSQNDILSDISELEGNKRFRIYVAKYVFFWKKYFHGFFKNNPYYTYLICYFITMNADKLIKNGVPKDGFEFACVFDMKAFAEQYPEDLTSDALRMMEQQEKCVPKAIQMFILLAYQWFYLSEAFPKTKEYSTEQVADIVLEFMKLYMSCDYWNDMFLGAFFMRFVEDKLKKKAAASTPAPVA
jgi:hypothetical protein